MKRHPWRFIEVDSKNLQSYLNLYVYLFHVKRDNEKRHKIARASHLMMTDAQFRSST